MAEMRTARGEGAFEHETRERQAHPAPARRAEREQGPSTGLLLAGVAAIALGAWAVYHFGPDFRRYIKMEMM